METMTLPEAETIFDIVTKALQDTSHRHVPVSALKGYDIYKICIALKLRVANEFLLLAGHEKSDETFHAGLNLYDSGPLLIAMRVVADDQVDVIGARSVFDIIDPVTMTFKGQRLASEETASSFGEYCKSVGQQDPIYWQKIYTRLALGYTSASPRGNEPVIPNGSHARERSSLIQATDPFEQASAYLAAALMSLVKLTARLRWGIATALLFPLFVRMALSTPRTQEELPALAPNSWIASVLVSLAFVVFAFFASDALRFEYPIVLGSILFIFCYSEVFPGVRRRSRE